MYVENTGPACSMCSRYTGCVHAQSRPICSSMDCSQTGYSVHGIFRSKKYTGKYSPKAGRISATYWARHPKGISNIQLFIVLGNSGSHPEDLIMTETFGNFPTYISRLILSTNSIAITNIKLYYKTVLMKIKYPSWIWYVRLLNK